TIVPNCNSKPKQEKSTSYLDLLKNAYLARCTAAICFMWCTMSLIHYGISFAVSSLAGNLYVNLLLLVIVELPGLPITFLLMTRIGRRWASVTLFALAFAASASSLALVLLGVAGIKSKAIRWLAFTIRLLTSCSWCAVQAWGTELYPTDTRSHKTKAPCEMTFSHDDAELMGIQITKKYFPTAFDKDPCTTDEIAIFTDWKST
ncbi:solute carrier family 22 member 4, partial [Plakobranchus ocellatus]